MENVSLKSFIGVPNLLVHKWLINHQLTTKECNRTGCIGDCEVVAQGDGVGLKCLVCNFISKGGHRSFWRMGKLPIAQMVLIVYCIILGFSLEIINDIVPINKNTWTSYVKYVGMVCGEALERVRRDPGHKYYWAQWDETAFGKHKYHRGSRVRNGGVQWALTAIQVDPITGKSEALDIQFLPLNQRSAKQITPLIVQRMKEGGTIFTDCWKAYPIAAKAAKCVHKTVNHSEGFINKETGVHTNNVEGIHATLKKDARKQFGRLPYLTTEGLPYYIDLVNWRVNQGLQKLALWPAFCRILKTWTKEPLEGWKNIVPLVEEDNVVDDQQEEDELEEDELVEDELEDHEDDDDNVPEMLEQDEVLNDYLRYHVNV